jgi:hypothetical protein
MHLVMISLFGIVLSLFFFFLKFLPGVSFIKKYFPALPYIVHAPAPLPPPRPPPLRQHYRHNLCECV